MTTNDDELSDLLIQSAFVVTAAITRVAAARDLSLTQARVLAILRDHRLRMSDLAAYLGLDRSTLTGLVDRAESRGLLERGRGAADARTVEVSATPAGAQLAAEVAREVAAELAPMLERLRPHDRQRLTGLLGRVLTVDPG